jgi:hypothetical protein
MRFDLADRIPVRTCWCYYLGFTPVVHHSRAWARMTVLVYRVREDFTPTVEAPG